MTQPVTLDEYRLFVNELDCVSSDDKIDICRALCRSDLFFLLWYGFGRKDMYHPWLLARCKEVQADPDGYLDLWARDHYKSTIITYALTIQDILGSHGDNPLADKWGGLEPTFGIFSHTRPIAKGFLRQIKRTLETNDLIKELFNDILWANPQKEAPKWSEDDGLILKRKTNPKESTIEAWGLVEGQPTSKHFNVLVYDDVVTQGSVNTPDMMAKTLQAWEMSINLGSSNVRRRHIGTRYHFNDAYREILARHAAKERIYPGTDDGTPEGAPVFKTREQITELRRFLGPYTFSTQILQNPLADETQGFKKDWIRWHGGSTGEGLNKYILVDPASEKKKTSDYTVMMVIGLGADENYYLLDIVRDRLNLEQRGDVLFRLHRKWRPLNVGYEKYGMQADVEHYRYRMRRDNYHFGIQELGGQIAKNDRIKALIPTFSEGRWYFPTSIFYTNYEGKLDDLVDVFINQEYLAFPVPVHDDMLDCLARILDVELGAMWPRVNEDEQRDRYDPKRQRRHSAWAA